MCPHLIAAMLAVTTFALAADQGAPPIRFTVANRADGARRTVVRVSVPVRAGAIAAEPGVLVATGGWHRVAAQSHVITRHTDGSVRRMMLSVPLELAAGEYAAFVCEADLFADDPRPILHGEDPARISTDAFEAVASRARVQLSDSVGRHLATIEPFGPVPESAPARMTVLEAGAHYVWLRYNMDGEQWAAEVDVEISRYGEISLTHRLQAREAGNHWTPDFGFEVTAPGANLARGPSAVTFMGLDYSAHFAEYPELVAPLALADGTAISLANPLALRQTRGTLEVRDDGGVVRVRSSRNEPVEQIEEDGLMIQEGQWRVSKLLIAPVGPEEMARRVDEPVGAHADWRLYDAVYRTGAPPATGRLLLLRAIQKYVQAMQRMSLSGDDWGNMTSWAPQDDEQKINSMVRFNHCRYVWEDYFRLGDPRLLEIARDWSENYRNLSVYWGPNEDFYGGSRRGRALRNEPGSPHGPGSYMVRYNNALGWITKGFAAFWLAYEETGDPRFREAAEEQARWSADKMTCLKLEMRSIGGVADYAKLYEYTGEPFHLQQAVRLWEEFQQGQLDNLLFTQHGKPAVGDHLYIQSDEFGYKHQFVKPYMVQYATNALPYLLEHRPDDQRLRDTILALNDWMATHRQPGGGWGYPHYLTAGMGWNNEYSHGIALACDLEPKEAYLDAIRENLAPAVQLLDRYGELPAGINPWEYAAGINAAERQRRYELATDRPVMRDYEQGAVRFGQSPDNCVYACVLLRDYLRHRSEQSLLGEDALLERIKRLRTTLDPRVIVPDRVVLAKDDPDAESRAELALNVDFRGAESMEASAIVTAVPEGVATEPETIRWTVARGRHASPAIRLAGAIDGEGQVAIRWRIGPWEGEATVALSGAAK